MKKDSVTIIINGVNHPIENIRIDINGELLPIERIDDDLRLVVFVVSASSLKRRFK